MKDMTRATGVLDVKEQTLAQCVRDKTAVRLLKKWLKGESGYDEEAWPKLKEAIEANRLSYRRRFNV